MKLSIIIPIFNEEKTVKILLERVERVKLPKSINKEIVVIDDGSWDLTPKILKMIKFKMVHIRHEKNLGKGAAIRTGLATASGDVFVIQDADLEYNPEDYTRLLDPILKQKAQVVYGTRLINYPLKLWGKDKTILPSHLIGNKSLTMLTNILYGSKLTDMETCYKLFTKRVFKNITLVSNRFEFEPEITAKILKARYNIIEIPIKVTPRTSKEGKKISWVDGLGAVWTLLKYRFSS